MKKDGSAISSNSIQQIMTNQPEQESFYTIEQELAFEERYSPEIRKQLQEVDIEMIIHSCPARLILGSNADEECK